MTQPYMENNLLTFINNYKTFISKVWVIFIMEYYITLKEDEAAPCVLT